MSGVRDTLQRFRARFGPGPRSFLAWWGQALATWLPARWRVLLGLTGDMARTTVLESAMPSMVTAGALAIAHGLALIGEESDPAEWAA